MITQYVAALDLPISRIRLEGCRPPGEDDLTMVSTYFRTPYWFDTPALLLANEFDALSRAKSNLIKRKRPLDPGRIIAEITFGFWTALLQQPYNARIWKRWRYGPLLATFPHIPRSLRDREKIWLRVDSQRQLRNRVFHYEPIWNRPTLWDDHEGICATIAWISPEMGSMLSRLDRFPDVFTNGRVHIEARLRQDLGI